MATTKSRREIFEEQLRDLQKDISNLSSKLSIPPMVSSTRVGTTTTFSTDSRIDSSSISIPKDPSSSFLSAAEATNPIPASEKESYFRQQVEVLTGDLTKAYKERDEAKRQVEQLTQENEELRKGLPEYARLKALYESLKQDHEALKTSLDSSERIRLQQKELIQVLQRSNSMGVDSSAASVQSISSISQKGDVSSMHSLAAMIGSQPTNSVLSGYQGHGGDTPQWVYTSPAQNYGSYAIAANQGSASQGNGNATAMKIRRSAEKTNTSTRKSRVVVSNNPLTRKKATQSGKGGDSEKKKKTKKNTAKVSASSSAYQRITQDVLNDSRPSSFQDILSQNQSLLSAANLQQLQNFHNLNTSPTPFLQQMMLNQSVADQSAALLETIQAQQRQPISLMQPESYGLPQNPEVSAARASVAATLTTSAGKPPRYPGAPSPSVTGTITQNQPITIPTATTRYDISANHGNKTPTLDRSYLSSGGVSKGSATARSPSPVVVVPRTAKSAPSPSSPVARPVHSTATGKASSGKGTKAKRKSSVETAGPTKVLYRPLPSPVSTFGTSRRL